MKTDYSKYQQDFYAAKSDEMKIIILRGWIAQLEQDKGELYVEKLDMKVALTQLANAAAILHGQVSTSSNFDVANAALWVELENCKKYL